MANPSQPGVGEILRPVRYNSNNITEQTNKPLPFSPADLVNRQSLSSETRQALMSGVPSSANSFAISNISAGSSAGLGRFAQKLEFDGLVSATMAGPQELSPSDYCLHSNSQTSQQKYHSPSSFQTFAKGNPFSQDQSTAPSQYLPTPYAQQEAISSAEWPFRSSRDPVRRRSSSISPSPRLRHSRGSVEKVRIEDASSSGLGRFDFLSQDPHKGISMNIRDPSTPSRGRPTNMETSKSRSRSQSPVKRIIGMVKSISTGQVSSTGSSPPKNVTPFSGSKTKWKELSHKMRYGFLTAGNDQEAQEDLMEDYQQGISVINPSTKRKRAVVQVSCDTAIQSRTFAELELLLVDSANAFLMIEYEHSRLSHGSVLAAKRKWEARTQPRVTEFIYDMDTQHDLVMANLRTIKLYGENAHDAIKLNGVLNQWRALIQDWPHKTLCMPDGHIRRYLQDTRRVLELLGASPKAMNCMDNLTISIYQVIRHKEALESDRRKASSASTSTLHHRSLSDGTSFNIFKQGLGPMPVGDRDGVPALPVLDHRRTLATREMTPYEKSVAQLQDLQRAGCAAAEAERVIMRDQGRQISLTSVHSGAPAQPQRYMLE